MVCKQFDNWLCFVNTLYWLYFLNTLYWGMFYITEHRQDCSTVVETEHKQDDIL
jgi:hypothetical protein